MVAEAEACSAPGEHDEVLACATFGNAAMQECHQASVCFQHPLMQLRMACVTGSGALNQCTANALMHMWGMHLLSCTSIVQADENREPLEEGAGGPGMPACACPSSACLLAGLHGAKGMTIDNLKFCTILKVQGSLQIDARPWDVCA